VVFLGDGPAVFDGTHGFVAHVAIVVSADGQARLRLVLRDDRELVSDIEGAASAASTTMWEGASPVALVPSSFAEAEAGP
jgi:hypothetical protein